MKTMPWLVKWTSWAQRTNSLSSSSNWRPCSKPTSRLCRPVPRCPLRPVSPSPPSMCSPCWPITTATRRWLASAAKLKLVPSLGLWEKILSRRHWAAWWTPSRACLGRTPPRLLQLQGPPHLLPWLLNWRMIRISRMVGQARARRSNNCTACFKSQTHLPVFSRTRLCRLRLLTG